MLSGAKARGFTLIELLVGIAIVGILIGLGAPSFAAFLQSSKLASAAQSYLSGVQLARAEAIRRNLPVEFVLTASPVAAGIENAATPSATGQNWVVRVLDPATSNYELIEAKAAVEGSFSSTGTSSIQINGSATPPTVFAGTVAFNGFGGTADGADYTFDIENPVGGTCASVGGPMRCPQIRIPPGGRVSLCDPAAAPGDSRAC